MGLRSSIFAGFVGALIGLAQATGAATVTTVVTAQSVKPLVITKVQDLNLGSVMLGPGVWSNATVSISQAGVLTCSNPNLTCTGAVQAAEYDVQGSAQQTVRITAPNVTLTNQSDSSQTLTLVTNAPASVLLANSGQKGTDFWVGGSVTLNSGTASGTYVGTFNVTVDY